MNEYELQVSEIKVLRKIFGPKMAEDRENYDTRYGQFRDLYKPQVS